MDARLDIPACPTDAVRTLREQLGVSDAVAQILVRRGLHDPEVAQAWLRAEERHDPSAFAGIDDAVALILLHVRAGSRITIHGDYDVDGVTSTAILLRALHTWQATVDHLLPDRQADGYGLTHATIDRLRARGTQLLITVDCAITAVDEVAAARAAGIDVIVTDHHTPRADGVLPDALIVHPGVCGYPFRDLCAAAVAHKLAVAVHRAAGGDPARADADLDLVALATVADCVPLHGENRRLVREGLGALATTRKPGLRALMRVSRVDPSTMDATDIGFRLAPRLNAAGRVARPDAALELLLTPDEDRAERIAEELDRHNADRRHTEERIRFDAERQIAELGERPAYVLWGEDWHSGVIGIVASRIAERHRRPVLLVAVRDGEGTGSGRSIPAFDLLAGLDACAGHLLRYGGHRAAAGCTVAADALPALRAAFEAHAAAVLRPEDLVPVARVDAVVAGIELGLELAEELQRLAPFGEGNPEPSLLLPACRMLDVRPMGEGRHLRFAVHAGGVSARAVAFGRSELPDGADVAVDATFSLTVNRWNGAVEPQLQLRHATAPACAAITCVDDADDWEPALRAALTGGAPSAYATLAPPAARRTVLDRRGQGLLGTVAALVASGEPVLVLTADTASRHRHLRGRIGGFTLASHEAALADPALRAAHRHLVLLDPPAHPAMLEALHAGSADQLVHHAWGPTEEGFAGRVHEHLHTLREPLADVYRALRAGTGLRDALRGDGERPRHAVLAARLLLVLEEAGLARVDRVALTAELLPSGRVDLSVSACFRACEERRAAVADRATPPLSPPREPVAA
ncbi:single-stranded-DNA-specific exonuclease RecJ [Paraconexibacter algicola]|uniref:Single-stranded-DNA-specific exonuclease RecJ n=1 Tax=Paraconexibacter algicola TaxID=2133960 RepID=A0A2T4UCE8_9ACTN|nr:single-stranded-DNA-specific exonuclease RecJ [Paraconexibacter algicola]PTL54872.1 single-stranded-DNA-specific exonuclease RecJ [Paraconexibacter algicola]